MDWVSAIVGAIIGFISSIGIMIVERILDRKGKLKLYYVLVCGEEITQRFGFSKTSDGKIAFIAPLKLEIQNTSNTARVIRDVSLLLCHDGKLVAEMIQIQHTSNRMVTNGKPSESKTTEFGGDKNSYSFVIQPRSIQREHCSFMMAVNQGEEDKYQFNEICLQYHNEADRKVTYQLRRLDDCWHPATLRGDDDWMLMDKKNRM